MVTPRTRVEVAEETRPSDTITGLMGGLALAFFLVAATLPRLRSLEFHGLKLGFGDDDDTTRSVSLAAAKVAGAAATEVVPAQTVRRAVGDDVFFALAREEGVVVVEDEAAVEQWAQAAVTQTLRRARAAKFEAALAGGDPIEATLSEEEIDAIVNRTRPSSLS